jgi:hypothetical protein
MHRPGLWSNEAVGAYQSWRARSVPRRKSTPDHNEVDSGLCRATALALAGEEARSDATPQDAGISAVTKSPFDIFDAGAPAVPITSNEPEPPRVAATEAHAKLKRNLDLALERHKEILSPAIAQETDVRNKRLVAEVATATVKAVLTTDRTALKARSDNITDRTLLRLLFIRYQRGLPVRPEHLERLWTAPRAEIEAALWPKHLVEYDRMKNAGW